MPSVEIFLNSSYFEGWKQLITILHKKGFEVNTEPKKCDISIVLSGQHINPFALTGKKVLLAYNPEWGKLFEHIFLPILRHYYDDVIDIYGKSIDSIIGIIQKYRGK